MSPFNNSNARLTLLCMNVSSVGKRRVLESQHHKLKKARTAFYLPSSARDFPKKVIRRARSTPSMRWLASTVWWDIRCKRRQCISGVCGKRFSEFEALHSSLRKALGWQISAVDFPKSKTFVTNKLSPELVEQRR